MAETDWQGVVLITAALTAITKLALKRIKEALKRNRRRKESQ